MKNTYSLFKDHMKSLGWTMFKSDRKRRKFYNKLSKDHPELTDQVFDIIESRGDEIERRSKGLNLDQNIYSLKNSNLDFSLRLSNFMTVEINDAIFKNLNLTSDGFSPKQILDLGSDNGFLTTFYAKLFPEANIVGLESENNGTVVSNELSKKLHIENCSFVNGDFFKFQNENKFDLITSITFMKEAVDSQFGYDLNKYENEQFINASELSRKILSDLANSLSSKLNEGGYFVIVERFPTIFEVCKFLDGFEDSKLKCDIENSTFIQFNGVEGEGKMPLLIFKFGDSKSSLPEIQQLYSKDVPMTNEAILDDGFYSYCLYHSILEKKLILEISCEYDDGSGTMFYKFYKSDTFYFMVEISNTGYFKLNMSCYVSRQELESVVSEIKERNQQFCDVKVFWK